MKLIYSDGKTLQNLNFEDAEIFFDWFFVYSVVCCANIIVYIMRIFEIKVVTDDH